jgi:hypothetical protein
MTALSRQLVGEPLYAILSITPVHQLSLKFKNHEEEQAYQAHMCSLRRSDHIRTLKVYVVIGVMLTGFDFIFIPVEQFKMPTMALHAISFLAPMVSFLFFKWIHQKWTGFIALTSLVVSILFMNIISDAFLLLSCPECYYYPSNPIFQIHLIFLYSALNYDVTTVWWIGFSLTVMREITLGVLGKEYLAHKTIFMVLENLACCFSNYQINILRRATFHIENYSEKNLQSLSPVSQCNAAVESASGIEKKEEPQGAQPRVNNTLTHGIGRSTSSVHSNSSKNEKIAAMKESISVVTKKRDVSIQEAELAYDKVNNLFAKSMTLLCINAIFMCTGKEEMRIVSNLDNVTWFLPASLFISFMATLFYLYSRYCAKKKKMDTKTNGQEDAIPLQVRLIPVVATVCFFLQMLILCAVAVMEFQYWAHLPEESRDKHFFTVIGSTILVYASIITLTGFPFFFCAILVFLCLLCSFGAIFLAAVRNESRMGWGVMTLVVTWLVLVVSKQHNMILKKWFTISNSQGITA